MTEFRSRRSAISPATDPWSRHLPDLITLLDGLARNVIDETNATNIGFLGYLREIEGRVLEGNRATDSFMARLGDVNRMAAGHEEERKGLDRALQDAIAFGSVVRDEIVASREALRSIARSIGQMQDELVKIGRISKEIGLLSVNASIESARAGDAGRGFQVISQSIRTLANDTHAITKRLNPLVEQVHNEVSQTGFDGASTAGDGTTTDLADKLTDQGALLDDVARKLAVLSSDYAALIEVQRERSVGSRDTGARLEETILGAMASAQTGDIIRQQIELIVAVLGEIRDVAAQGWDDESVDAGLARIRETIAGSYVMKIQHDIHRATTAGTGGSDGPPRSQDDDLPSFEMF